MDIKIIKSQLGGFWDQIWTFNLVILTMRIEYGSFCTQYRRETFENHVPTPFGVVKAKGTDFSAGVS